MQYISKPELTWGGHANINRPQSTFCNADISPGIAAATSLVAKDYTRKVEQGQISSTVLNSFYSLSKIKEENIQDKNIIKSICSLLTLKLTSW